MVCSQPCAPEAGRLGVAFYSRGLHNCLGSGLLRSFCRSVETLLPWPGARAVFAEGTLCYCSSLMSVPDSTSIRLTAQPVLRNSCQPVICESVRACGTAPALLLQGVCESLPCGSRTRDSPRQILAPGDCLLGRERLYLEVEMPGAFLPFSLGCFRPSVRH